MTGRFARDFSAAAFPKKSNENLMAYKKSWTLAIVVAHGLHLRPGKCAIRETLFRAAC
jgi:hypothetical protein